MEASILIAGMLGSWGLAEVAAATLRWTLPDDIEPDCATRVTWAARWFALLYPMAVLGCLSLLGLVLADSVSRMVAGGIITFVPATLACLPLAIAIGQSTRSLIAGVLPVAAIGLTVAALAVLLGFTERLAFVWFFAAPPMWLACTIIGLRWVVRPRWPLVTDRWLRCPACGYSREGLTGGRCPECGSPLPTPEGDAAAAATADAASPAPR